MLERDSSYLHAPTCVRTLGTAKGQGVAPPAPFPPPMLAKGRVLSNPFRRLRKGNVAHDAGADGRHARATRTADAQDEEGEVLPRQGAVRRRATGEGGREQARLYQVRRRRSRRRREPE